MQATTWMDMTAVCEPPRLARGGEGPSRAAALLDEAAETVEALFGPWEAQLEASLRRLTALQNRLDSQARRLHGLESELASLAPAATGWGTSAR